MEVLKGCNPPADPLSVSLINTAGFGDLSAGFLRRREKLTPKQNIKTPKGFPSSALNNTKSYTSIAARVLLYFAEVTVADRPEIIAF